MIEHPDGKGKGGRPATAANGRPVALTLRADSIPDELSAADNWLVWRYDEETDPETGEVDWDKPPRNARTGGLASSTNPKTWAPFGVALAAYGQGGLDGVGFALDGKDDLVAIDLDKCRDPETGSVEPWVQKVIDALNSYTEVSPSGRGIRIFVRGRLPAHGRKKGRFECYCKARYVTVTGQRVRGTPRTVERREAELLEVHRGVFGEPAPEAPAGRGAAAPADLDDAEIVRLAGESKSGAKFKALWSGSTSGYGSHSEADLALANYLAFFCGPNSGGRIDALFRQSGLFRSKWQRDDYRERTIRKALEGRTEFYEPRPAGRRRDGGRGAKVTAPGQAGGPAAHTNGTPGGAAPTPGAGDLGPEDDPHLTDVGNALRLVKRHGREMLYCHPWRSWLEWDGRRWAQDQVGGAVRRVKDTQAAFYREVAEQVRQLGDVGDDRTKRARLEDLTARLKHALRWEDAKRIAACLELARSEVPVLPAQLDADPMLLNVLNGTIDLRTGELRGHRLEDRLTKLAPVEYDPGRGCPLWLRFLERIMGGNVALIDYLQRVVGYALTGDVSEQALWFFHGGGANGKSTFLATVLALLGDYGMQAVSDLLMAKRHEAHSTERADLFGKRFVATIETEEGKRLAEALMKQMTGGDRVRARKLYQDFFEFEPTHKIFLAANHRPAVLGADHAVWRRIKLVPFAVTIPEAEKDPHLGEKLQAELPGILRWAVDGCLGWQRGGLREPKEVREATEAYQAEQDLVAGFLGACCFVNAQARVKVSALYDAYAEWSGDKVMSQRSFNDRLKSRGHTNKRGHGGAYFWHGIGLAGGAGEPN
jgi:putative DNA primase/helicase